MVFGTIQVWTHVPARPLTGGVMLDKSWNSLSLSFPICTRESADQRVWPTVSHRGIISPPGHTLRPATPGWFLPQAQFSALMPSAASPLGQGLILLHGGHLLREAFPESPEGWSILVP